ncbi:MAG: LVIVD repeat-containing protein [bacterium]
MLKKRFIPSFPVLLTFFICICSFLVPALNAAKSSLALEIKALKKAGEYDTPGEARSVNVVGKYAYVGDGDTGLLIIDISDPSKPDLVSSFDTPGYACDVAIDGDYAYIADCKMGIQIVDIKNSSMLKGITNYKTNGYACGILYKDGYPYVADSEKGLQILKME